MITCSSIGYNGRLGNQIFQLAALFGISKKTGLDFRIPKSNLYGKEQILADGTRFSAKVDLCNIFDINDCFTDDIDISYRLSESSFSFDSNLFHINDKTDINGYFQSYKYFEHCREELMSFLSISPKILARLPDIFSGATSIHVRRGDYVCQSQNHPVCDINYYKKAISHFDGKFIVFSDDVPWCKENFPKDFIFFESNCQFLDFAAITMCGNHIISNSTFSWWASYLSKNKDKTIIGPEKWFGEAYSHLDTSGLYHPGITVL